MIKPLRRAQAPMASLNKIGQPADTADQFRAIVEDSVQGIVVHRGKPLYVNTTLVNMLDLASRDEFLRAASVLDHIHPEDRELVREQMAKRLAGEDAAAHYEFRLLRRDGQPLWVHCTGQRIVWDGAPAAIASLYETTAQKRAEQALRRSEKLFVTVFHSSPDMISLTTLDDGRYVDVNDSFLRMFNHRREELIGKTSAEIGFWTDPDFRRVLVERLRSERSLRDVEGIARTSNGETRNVTFSIDLIRFEDRDLLLSIGRDVTERRRQEEELRQSKEAAELANRSKSEFLANMSHELRTPLNAILGFSEVIRDQLFGPVGTARYTDYARDIHGSGQHLLGIINDLLDLSKLEAGKVELHEDNLALPRLIEDCIRLVRGRAENGGLKLRVALAAALPQIRADTRLLKQILINLLSNATKFTPAGGTVTVSGRLAPNGGVEIDVADTGIGMSEADIQVALTPFGQVDGSFSRRHEGTGLGLPLVRALVDLHGGTLVIRSMPGEGTTVSIQLPSERVIPDRDAVGQAG